MTLNKETEYAILLCLYICRAGRATVDTAAANMNVSKPFMAQVARKLKLASILSSHRGPGGGYSLVYDKLTLYDVILNMGNEVQFLSSSSLKQHIFGSTEQVSLYRYAKEIDVALYAFLDIPLTQILAMAIEAKFMPFNSMHTGGLEQ